MSLLVSWKGSVIRHSAWKCRLAIGVLVVWMGASLACSVTPVAGPTRPPITETPPPVLYSQPQLEYRIISNFGEVFWCDPDFYPVGRPGQEERNAREQFATIMADEMEFSAILEKIGLAVKADYTNDEKLAIYREHKKLTRGVQISLSGDVYTFTVRVGQGQGQRIEGVVTKSGEITVVKRETSFNTCPICLSVGTLIDTPGGPVAVENLRQGTVVWIVDALGNKVAAPVLETVTTTVPAAFEVVRVTLYDGRSVTASPGHPSADRKALGDYGVGDILDGARVMSSERVIYGGGATFDILPAGGTGLYWADGILLMSTIPGR